MNVDKICQGCELEVSMMLLTMDLRVMDMSEFDVILGMDWLMVHRVVIVAPLSRPDSFGGSEPSPGCSNVTQSPYQNHLSKTRRSVTLQLT